MIAIIIDSIIRLTSVIGKYQNNAKNTANSASEFALSMNSANSTYNTQKETLETLTQKYKDLRQQLIAAKGSEEETYLVKSQLLDLQKQLNQIYDDEYKNVNLVTDAYKNQTSLLEIRNKQQAQNYLNENAEMIDTASQKMTTEYNYELGNFNYGLADANIGNDLHNQIKQLAKNNGIEWDDKKGFVFKGNAENASESISQFMSDVRELQNSQKNLPGYFADNFKSFYFSMSKQLGYANAIIDGYKETYENAQIAQIKSDTSLSIGYDKATSAVEAYNEAVLKSNDPYNDENVANAWHNLQTIKQGIQENKVEWGAYSNIMEDVFSAANDNVYSFYQALQNDNSISGLAKNLKGLSDVELQAMYDDGDNGDVFDKLLSKAEAYGIEVQDLIDLLIRLGYVQGNMTDSTTDNSANYTSFRQAWDSIDTTENEDLNGMKENLLTLAGTGRLTQDTFSETEGSSTFLSMLGIEPSDKEKIETLILQINQLKSSSEQLSSMKNGISGLSDNLSYREQNPGEAISSDVLAGMDSGLKDQTEEWKEYQSVLGDANSSMEEVREATNKLASAYVNSNNFLANLTEANKDYYISQLDAMGVENAESIVQDELCRKYDLTRLMAMATNYAENDLKHTKHGITDATISQINLLLQEQGATDGVRNAILTAVEAMRIFAASDLGVSEKITAMESLIATTCGLDAAISFANQTGGYDDRGFKLNTIGDEAVNIAQNIILNSRKINLTPPRTPQNSPTGNTNKSADKQPEKKEFKESFNWLERFIKRLQGSFDKWLAQAETALTSGFLDIYYRKAASFAQSQLSTYDNAYNKYMEKANAVGLDEGYAGKVRNGALDIDTIEDEGLAKKNKGIPGLVRQGAGCHELLPGGR